MSIFQDPQNIGQAFAAVARQRGGQPALRYPDGTEVSYARLDAAANGVAVGLRDAGVRRGRVVAICQDKTPQGYAAMLACLKLGAPYVNLDPDSPQERVARILATADPVVLATDGPLPPAVEAAAQGGRIPVHGLPAALPDGAPPAEASAGVAAHDIAYLMFTSGSTGMPKGVAITHGNLAHFLSWAHRAFDVTPQDVLTGVNPIYFDNSVYDTFGALLAGACLAPVDRKTLNDPAALLAAVEACGCTQWFSVPSLLIYLMTLRLLDGERLASLRQIAFGGEGYPKGELKRLWDLYGGRARVLNVYGPTETTCICSVYAIGARDFQSLDGLPPLGTLADNIQGLLMVDDRAAEPGEPGELCLLGPTVGAGYYNAPDRTAQAFQTSPLHPALPTRMYRTGDLVRRDPDDGLLYFVGRKDNQIKHMGYRIELEEIEAALARLAPVRQAAVVYHRRTSRHGRIVAFVAADGETDPQDLRERLATILPAYMIPQELYLRDALPKNANGKVDRNGLLGELTG